MAIEQGSLACLTTVTRESVYSGHFRLPVTLTPVAERLAVKLSLPDFTTWVCRGWDSNPAFRMQGERSNRLRHRGGCPGVEKILNF